VHATLIDEASARALPLSRQLDALINLVEEDASALGCGPELQAARRIATAGTGADRQFEIFKQGRGAGLDAHAAMCGVVDWLSVATAASGDG